MTTIKDIAKAAGVSITTVSRALNNYHDVSDETKKKIKDLAQELGYNPNIAARSLVVKKTKTIGLLLSGINRNSTKDNLAYEILCGMNDRSSELDYDLVLFSTNTPKQKQKSYKSLCQERGVDGIIIMGIRLDDPYLQEIVDSTIPCVMIDIHVSNKKVAYITSDDVSGARSAVLHLIENGHKHIGFINGHAQTDVSIKRLEGYRKALKEANIPYRENYIADAAFSEAIATEASIRLLSQHSEITAIFCSSDLMALGAMQGIRMLGRQVPDDISVIGYDNIWLSSYCTPLLTTIHQSKYEKGYQAAQLLIDMLEGRKVSHHIMFPTELIMRDSVKKI